MMNRIRFFVLSALLFPLSAWGLSPAQQQYIDVYIAAQKDDSGVAVKMLEQIQHQLNVRVGLIEGHMTQLEPFLISVRAVRVREEFKLDSLLDQIATAGQTPYDNAGWTTKFEEKLMSFCCRVQQTPALKQRLLAGPKSKHKKKQSH